RSARGDYDGRYRMISRRSFIGFLAAGLVLTSRSRSSNAQQGKIFRVGVLLPGPQNPAEEFFRSSLRDLGYTEGKNLVLEFRNVPPENLASAAQELVRMNVDVIWAAASNSVRAAVSATKKTPIVAVDLESDPLASGYALSLARPGGNVTGFFLDLPGFSAKRLEILKDALPKLSSVTILWDPTLDRAPLSTINAAARELRLRLVVNDVRSAKDLERAFEGVNRRSHAIVMMQSPTIDSYGVQIVKLGEKFKVPVMAVFAIFVAEGALLSYGPSGRGMVVQSATYVDRVLRGARPGDLPIQRPFKFDLAVNAKTAKALGLTIGQSVILRADEVIH
ncbi:MAG: ABC transporter substrate-binding protein, partial [Gammaproteobacteria bacterium]